MSVMWCVVARVKAGKTETRDIILIINFLWCVKEVRSLKQRVKCGRAGGLLMNSTEQQTKKDRLKHTADSVLLMRIKQQTRSCTELLSTVHWRCESGATGTLSGSWMSQRPLEIDTAGMALITLFTKWIIYQTQTPQHKSQAHFLPPG